MRYTVLHFQTFLPVEPVFLLTFIKKIQNFIMPINCSKNIKNIFYLYYIYI